MSRLYALAAVALVALAPLPAAAALTSMSVFPSRAELVVAPGEAQTFGVTVANPGKVPLRVRAYMADWSLAPTGEMLFHPAGQQTYSVHRMVTFSPAQFVLQPEQSQTVRITATVPTGTVPGEYHGMVFFETTPPQTPKKQKGTTILFNQRVGHTLYVGVQPIRKKATVTGLAYFPPKDKQPPRMGIALQNLGDAHVRAEGELTILRADGTVVERKAVTEVFALRGTKRLYFAPLARPLGPGKYRATLRLEYGGDEVLEAETLFER